MVVRRPTGLAVASCLIACLPSGGAVSVQRAQQVLPSELAAMAGFQRKQTLTEETSGAKLELDGVRGAGLIGEANVPGDGQMEFLYTRPKSPLAPKTGGCVGRLPPSSPEMNSDANFSPGVVHGVKLFAQTASNGAASCDNDTCHLFQDWKLLRQVTGTPAS
jgi:hypothetical protein